MCLFYLFPSPLIYDDACPFPPHWETHGHGNEISFYITKLLVSFQSVLFSPSRMTSTMILYVNLTALTAGGRLIRPAGQRI
jgi:hypothetical protein